VGELKWCRRDWSGERGKKHQGIRLVLFGGARASVFSPWSCRGDGKEHVQGVKRERLLSLWRNPGGEGDSPRPVVPGKGWGENYWSREESMSDNFRTLKGK